MIRKIKLAQTTVTPDQVAIQLFLNGRPSRIEPKIQKGKLTGDAIRKKNKDTNKSFDVEIAIMKKHKSAGLDDMT